MLCDGNLYKEGVMSQELMLYIMGGLFVIVWWFMTRKIVELEKNDAAHTAEITLLRDAKAELKLHIAENYIKRSEIKEIMERIDTNLREIFAELKGKADK